LETILQTKPKLAFTGVGWIGRHRMQVAVESGLADVRLISDPSNECVSEALKLASTSQTTTSFDDVINHPDVDAVVIATPSALHMEQAVAAFKNGKAVFCQKPLGRNAEEVRAVVDAARSANRLLGADFSYRYTAAFKAILPIIQSGELGRIFAVDLKFHNAYGPDKPWFYNKQLSGGGCVLDLGIHLIDLLLFALDFPEVENVNSRLYSKGLPLRSGNEVEDYADVQLQLANDINAHLACSWNLQAGCEAVIEASFYGTKGGVALKNTNGSFYDFVGLRYWGTKSESLVQPPDAWGGRAMVDWIEKLSINPDFDPAAENFIASAAILDRIYEGH